MESKKRIEELYETLTTRLFKENEEIKESEKDSNGAGEGKDQEWKKKIEEILSPIKEIFEEMCTQTAEQKKTRILKDDAEPVKQDDELMVQGVSGSQRSKKKDEEGQGE